MSLVGSASSGPWPTERRACDCYRCGVINSFFIQHLLHRGAKCRRFWSLGQPEKITLLDSELSCRTPVNLQ